MLFAAKPSRRLRSGGGLLALGIVGLLAPAPTAAAAPPQILEAWASGVFTTTARVHGRINPNGLASTYRVEYLSRSAYEANLAAAKEPFAGASRAPSVSDLPLGSGAVPVTVQLQLSSLSPETAYRYRLVARNSSGTEVTAALPLQTHGVGGPALPDDRGWEMVSPVDKNGGEVAAPGTIAGGGVLQGAAAGGAVTYGSSASFGPDAQGAAIASQYLATRTAAGWVSANITAPLYSSSYASDGEGTPYRIFSEDLARGLLLSGERCRGEGSECPVANPPLPGTDAPAGYQNYYLREGPTYTALLGAANAGFLALEPSDFELRLTGYSPDLRHPVLSSCAALTADATEAALGEGCDPAQQNLYRYAQGQGLTLVNILPAQSTGTPGAVLAAQSGAVSADGSRLYFTLGGNLHLREGAATKQVDAAAGGGGSFETASGDGQVAYFTKAGHLWRYLAAGAGAATDLTPGGGVLGVLGASADGAVVYYLTAGGLFRWHSGATTKVADAADASNYPPATGTARVSADGTKVLFLSSASLTGYDNKDLLTGAPDTQVYLHDAGSGLICLSCNPTFARPLGPSGVPGAIANGAAPGSIQTYKPRALAAGGRRVFFESRDALALSDTNNSPDVYQWEAQGTGSCTRAPGCVALISEGHTTGGSSFADASADGADAFFLTGGSLVPSDPGGADLYDARIGGGFPVPSPPIACNGDACQPLPSEPVDPTLTTLIAGPGNPAVRYPKVRKRCKKGYVRRRGKCVRKKVKRRKAAKERKGGR
ncbi:MAG TPA: hypothetical protein VFY04_03580 [Solirubrobacterales bacterium]|nr:hypothetical protein [Solirubrobacterales bacterium]